MVAAAAGDPLCDTRKPHETADSCTVDLAQKGMMPPKGGFVTLSDDEVRAAIAYMTTASAP